MPFTTITCGWYRLITFYQFPWPSPRIDRCLKVPSLLYCDSSCLPSTVWPILTMSRYSLMGPNLLLLWDQPWSVVILPFLVASLFSSASFLLNWEPSLVLLVMSSFVVYLEPSFIPNPRAPCSAWLLLQSVVTHIFTWIRSSLSGYLTWVSLSTFVGSPAIVAFLEMRLLMLLLAMMLLGIFPFLLLTIVLPSVMPFLFLGRFSGHKRP